MSCSCIEVHTEIAVIKIKIRKRINLNGYQRNRPWRSEYLKKLYFTKNDRKNTYWHQLPLAVD
jgi:hypothetical protein